MITKPTPTLLRPATTHTGSAGEGKIVLPAIYKTRQMFEIEQGNGDRDIRLILLDDYNALGSQAAVAKKHGVSQATITDWFEMLGIVIETTSVAKLTPVVA